MSTRPQVDQLVVVLGARAERDTGEAGVPVQRHVELDRAVAERRVAQQSHAIVDEERWTFEVRPSPPFASTMNLKAAVRRFRRTAGLSVVMLITLALGIGAVATILTLFNAFFWRPLPGVQDPAALVAIGRGAGSPPCGAASPGWMRTCR
jgi:hypothetical protein